MLKIALPNKGRLADDARSLLADAGLEVRSRGERALMASLGGEFEAIFLRSQDIPEFVADGVADAGITGWDLAVESGRNVVSALDLEFGACTVVLAARDESRFNSMDDIEGAPRVATSFPRITRNFFDRAGRKVEIVPVSGATEIAPHLGIAELIVDITSSGSTLRMNGMRRVITILESTARLITNGASAAAPRDGKEMAIADLVAALTSVLRARGKRYLMANVARSSLDQVRKVLPGLNGPTVIDILNGGSMVAVHAVVSAGLIYRTIADLKQLGAEGILVTRIERLMPVMRSPLRLFGALSNAASNPESQRVLFRRSTSSDAGVRTATASVIQKVATQGDSALRDLANTFDGVALESLEVPYSRMRAALDALPRDLRSAVERAAANIASVHTTALPRERTVEPETGVQIVRRAHPFERVGIYAPGGTATYPSSVLMGAIPARCAGVAEVILCSPPQPDGAPATTVLAAASIAGVHRVFALGGAGAIAAMALGTKTVPRVQKIVGPGNAYVAEAKLQLSGYVAFDSPAGPSELLVIADESASPEVIAREMLAQAEHDSLASVTALCATPRFAKALCNEIESQLPSQERREIMTAALANRGAVLWYDSIDEAIQFANAFAPEHLLIATSDRVALSMRVRNAGTIFIGECSSVTFGDYMTGANHVLPTGSLARSYSGLSTDDFMRWTTYQSVSPEAARSMARDVSIFASAESLPAHAAAASAWRRGVTTTWQASAETTTGLDFARTAYREISLYAPDRAPCRVDLSDNTNLFGIPPAALRELSNPAPQSISRYPSLYADDVKRAIADYLGVPPECIVTGCGSDDVLDSAMRAFCEPGDRVALPDPSFAMIPLFARMNGLGVKQVPLLPGFDVDAQSLAAVGAKLTYICSPNNPTGGAVSDAAFEHVLGRCGGLLVLDEAYAEFAPATFVHRAVESKRLLVVRTLSKAFGLAGLRIGYAVGAPELVAEVEKSRGPYKVSSVAARAAIAALTVDRIWVGEKVAEVIANRARLKAELLRLRLFSPPSDANFVLAQVSDAAGTSARMRAKGVAVRPFADLPHIGNAIRITIGPWTMMEEALSVLESSLA